MAGAGTGTLRGTDATVATRGATVVLGDVAEGSVVALPAMGAG